MRPRTFQSAPRAEGGDPPAPTPAPPVELRVSIRAPAWGATCSAPGTNTWIQVPVSIRAPAWGATPSTTSNAVGAEIAVSIRRPRVGGDDLPARVSSRFSSLAVSIRAPAKGATPPRRADAGCELGRVSIRAPAWGATSDAVSGHRSRTAMVFQSAPPRGGRPIWPDVGGAREPARFNPRPRVGGDSRHRIHLIKNEKTWALPREPGCRWHCHAWLVKGRAHNPDD